jgi:hypothetical protein
VSRGRSCGALRLVIASIYPLFAMASRESNERKFGNWQDLEGGGRRYWFDVLGRNGWLARYVKEVDAGEVTTRFWQEICDESGKLVEIHEKFPVDHGHRKV